MNLKRRDFIKASAMGVGGILFGAQQSASAAAATFDPFERVPLGKTGLKPTRFVLGTGMNGGNRQSNHTRMGKEKFNALINGCYERGVRAFDLADLYGTHTFFADAIKGRKREDYLIFSKIWWNGGGIPDAERPAPDVVVARFLKELQTDYIDLLLLHCVTSPNWPTELSSQMESMAKLKSKGILRAVGVSCHSLEALEKAASESWVDSVHARINPYGQSMDGPAAKVAPVLKKIHDAGKGVVGMKIMGEGHFRHDDEKRDASVKYALTLGSVSVMAVGCENLDEVDDFVTRVRKVSKEG
jgi:aryl-alcohol dehydrogenase-like predicted oxidoreductase